MAQAGPPSSFDSFEFQEEGRWEKFSRKLRQEPLIPFGLAVTCYALYKASRSIRAGDHHQTNKWFRARIYGQFFTIVCVVGGSYYYQEERSKRKVFENAVAEKKTMEKREAWIRELEARDQEEKEIRARKEKAMLAQGEIRRDAARARKEKQASTSTSSGGNSSLEDSEMRRTIGFGVVDAVRRLRGDQR